MKTTETDMDSSCQVTLPSAASLARAFAASHQWLRMLLAVTLLTALVASPRLRAAQEPRDFTSKVPQYTFASTLAGQQAELKTNALLLRMNESRRKMADDPHRPIYHYVNPEGRLNDPTGLCRWQGRWHLFYQAYPPEDLGIEPAGNVESLRHNHRRVEPMTLPANQEIILPGIRGNAMELEAEIDPKGAPMVELNVLRAPNKEEHTRIMFFKNRGYRGFYNGKRGQFSTVGIDSSYSSILPDVVSRSPEMASVFLDRNEPLKLRVFIDRSVVEVFINGRQCVALRVYPGRPDSVGVSLRAQGQDALLTSLDAWQMKSIYQ